MPINNDNRDLQTIAYETIRKQIVLLELKPGERLSALSLEKKMGIGRTPIRESFVRMRERGLVRTVPQSGTYVSKISICTAKNICRLREAVECRVVEECCAKYKQDFAHLFDEALERQSDAIRRSDPKALLIADNQFHEACYDVAGRHVMWEWQMLFNADFERYRLLYNITEEIDTASIIRQHNALYSAIQRNDPFDASAIACMHLHHVIDRCTPVYKQYTEFFED